MRRLLALLLFFASAAQAAPVLNPLFSDHGVLQRGRPIAVWGTASPRRAGQRLAWIGDRDRDRRSRRRMARHLAGDGRRAALMS